MTTSVPPQGCEYTRPLAATWWEPAIVQRALHKLPWGVNAETLDAVKEPKVRLWYAECAKRGKS
jgi:hypothetical protein